MRAEKTNEVTETKGTSAFNYPTAIGITTQMKEQLNGFRDKYQSLPKRLPSSGKPKINTRQIGGQKGTKDTSIIQ